MITRDREPRVRSRQSATRVQAIRATVRTPCTVTQNVEIVTPLSLAPHDWAARTIEGAGGERPLANALWVM